MIIMILVNGNRETNPIYEMISNPSTVRVASRSGEYYIEDTDLENYMMASNTIGVSEAVDAIAEANNILSSDITVIVSENSDLLSELNSEMIAVQEKSSYSDATTPGAVMKWYRKFLASMKGGKATPEVLDDKIKILEVCVSNMERELKKTGVEKYASGDRIKYALKAIIPFNGLARLIKHRDAFAPGSTVSAFLVSIVTRKIMMPVALGLRYGTYTEMLKKQIELTKDAIEFLKDKKKELSKSSKK